MGKYIILITLKYISLKYFILSTIFTSGAFCSSISVFSSVSSWTGSTRLGFVLNSVSPCKCSSDKCLLWRQKWYLRQNIKIRISKISPIVISRNILCILILYKTQTVTSILCSISIVWKLSAR